MLLIFHRWRSQYFHRVKGSLLLIQLVFDRVQSAMLIALKPFTSRELDAFSRGTQSEVFKMPLPLASENYGSSTL